MLIFDRARKSLFAFYIKKIIHRKCHTGYERKRAIGIIFAGMHTWLYVLLAMMILAAVLLAIRNHRETGVSIWRSLFYSLLLIVGIMALLLTALGGGKH